MMFTRKKLKIKTKINQIYLQKLMATILAFFILCPVGLVRARTFNPNNIFSDSELFDKNSLTKTAIQSFLTKENSVLSRYSLTNNGQVLKASEAIWSISQEHGINPKFILATLEKEQGLISKSQATEKALDWATGYGCYSGTCKEKYQGFYNQIEATAETQNIYFQKAGQFSFQVGKTTTSYDGYKVTPQNQATANLYVYTPYVGYSPELGVTQPYGGNRLFWRIWSRYFTNQKFLDGQVVKNGSNFWLIQNNQKRKFAGSEIFLADYSMNDAIAVSTTDLSAYPDGPSIEFTNNALVKSAGSGQIYLLADNTKRPIINNTALALLNDFKIAITETDIPLISDDKLNSYTVGTLIDASSVYPQGKLFKDPSGQIWLVKDGFKYKVDGLVWQNRFNSQSYENITTADLDRYPTGEPLKLKDGTFVINNNKYYLISNGERMKIEDPTIFDRTFGLDKKNTALTVSTALLEIHGAGEIIDYADDTIKDSSITSTPTNNSISGTYSATFSSMQPDGLIMANGETQAVTLNFKNTGNANWLSNNVWLQVTDKGLNSTSFGVAEKINFSESSVGAGQNAAFVFNLTAPTDKTGLLSQEFTLYYNKNGAPEKITSIGKFIIVKAGDSAEIISHNLPVAIKNNWRPISITMKIKNNSSNTTWLSRRTALEIYNADGSTSYFYDPNDWVRKEVAAVPINQTYIKPGETGEFKFTLDPRGIKPGTYNLNFKLELLDQDKQIFLNDSETWRREIRVD